MMIRGDLSPDDSRGHEFIAKLTAKSMWAGCDQAHSGAGENQSSILDRRIRERMLASSGTRRASLSMTATRRAAAVAAQNQQYASGPFLLGASPTSDAGWLEADNYGRDLRRMKEPSQIRQNHPAAQPGTGARS